MNDPIDRSNVKLCYKQHDLELEIFVRCSQKDLGSKEIN